jgi:hypothetical protein
MAFPITEGSNPETETLPADQWTLVASGVLQATISNLYNANQLVYFTYALTTDPAPADLTIPFWTLADDYDKFDGARVPRNLYIYPVAKTAKIMLET